MVLRILHVVPGLGMGGAEANLQRLIQHLPPEFAHDVVDLGNGGPMQAPLEQAGARVISLNLRRHPLRAITQLRRALSRVRPQVVQGWLYKGNILASVAAWLAPGPIPTIWSIRHSLEAWRQESWQLRLLVRLSSWRVWQPWLVTYNGLASQRTHLVRGYQRFPSQVVGNLLDTEHFAPNPTRRDQLRQQLGFDDHHLLMGVVGRYHPIKNLPALLAAAQQLQQRLPQMRLVLVGEGFDATNLELQTQLQQRGLQAITRLLGSVEDTAPIFNALDLLVSASFSEATSNVLLEASACACASVATNVGDAARVLPASALVAAPTASWLSATNHCGADLAMSALPLLLDSDARIQQAQASRQRVLQQHGLSEVAASFAKAYCMAVAEGHGQLPSVGVR